MTNYIDGFVFPIASDRLAEYRSVAEQVAEIYREHGAIEYVEFVGDDMRREGTRTFEELVSVTSGESIVFGWVVFDSREHRDLVNERVETDPRMADLVAPLIDPATQVFDATRMAYAGFKPLVAARGTQDV